MTNAQGLSGFLLGGVARGISLSSTISSSFGAPPFNIAGILWLIFTPGFWLGTGGTLGRICHIVSAYCAYSYAKEHPIRI